MTTMTMSVHVYDYNGIVLHQMQPDISVNSTVIRTLHVTVLQ